MIDAKPEEIGPSEDILRLQVPNIVEFVSQCEARIKELDENIAKSKEEISKKNSEIAVMSADIGIDDGPFQIGSETIKQVRYRISVEFDEINKLENKKTEIGAAIEIVSKVKNSMESNVQMKTNVPLVKNMFEKVRANAEEIGKGKDKLNEDIAKIEKKIDKRKEIKKKLEEIKSLKESINDCENKKKTESANIASLVKRSGIAIYVLQIEGLISEKTAIEAKLNETLESLKKMTEELNGRIEAAKKDNEAFGQMIQRNHIDVEEYKKRMELQKLTYLLKIAAIEKEKSDYIGEIHKLKEELVQAKVALERANETIAKGDTGQLAKEIEDLKKENVDLRWEINDILKTNPEKSREELAALRAKNEALETEVEALRKQIVEAPAAEMVAPTHITSSELGDLKQRLEMLEQHVTDFLLAMDDIKESGMFTIKRKLAKIYPDFEKQSWELMKKERKPLPSGYSQDQE